MATQKGLAEANAKAAQQSEEIARQSACIADLAGQVQKMVGDAREGAQSQAALEAKNQELKDAQKDLASRMRRLRHTNRQLQTQTEEAAQQFQAEKQKILRDNRKRLEDTVKKVAMDVQRRVAVGTAQQVGASIINYEKTANGYKKSTKNKPGKFSPEVFLKRNCVHEEMNYRTGKNVKTKGGKAFMKIQTQKGRNIGNRSNIAQQVADEHLKPAAAHGSPRSRSGSRSNSL